MSPARKRNLVIYIVGGVLMITLPLFAVWMGSIVSGSEGTVISDELQFFRNALLVASAVAAVLLLVLYWHFQQLLSEYLQEKRKVEEKLETYSARLTSYIESPEYVSIFSLDRDMCYTGFNSLHQKEMRLYFHAHAEEGAYIVDLYPRRSESAQFETLNGLLMENTFLSPAFIIIGTILRFLILCMMIMIT